MVRAVRMRVQQTRLDDKTRTKLLNALDGYSKKIAELERGEAPEPPAEP